MNVSQMEVAQNVILDSTSKMALPSVIPAYPLTSLQAIIVFIVKFLIANNVLIRKTGAKLVPPHLNFSKENVLIVVQMVTSLTTTTNVKNVMIIVCPAEQMANASIVKQDMSYRAINVLRNAVKDGLITIMENVSYVKTRIVYTA
jgi:hypothetical protein